MSQNILFVCTGNSCRSVMAEGLFRRAVAGREKDFVVGSAGVAAYDGYPSTMETIRAMRKEGVDVSGHRSRRLTREMVREADKIFVMEKMHREMILNFWPEAVGKVRLLTQFSPSADEKMLELDVPDPIGTSDEFYGQTLKIIDGCVREIIKTF